MSRQAISVTLDADNVTWLRGRVRAAGARSLSELVDRLVTSARESGEVGPSRSVAGTIDVDTADPLLKRADATISAPSSGPTISWPGGRRKQSRRTATRAAPSPPLSPSWRRRPVVARESRGAYGGRAKTRKRRG